MGHLINLVRQRKAESEISKAYYINIQIKTFLQQVFYRELEYNRAQERIISNGKLVELTYNQTNRKYMLCI